MGVAHGSIALFQSLNMRGLITIDSDPPHTYNLQTLAYNSEQIHICPIMFLQKKNEFVLTNFSGLLECAQVRNSQEANAHMGTAQLYRAKRTEAAPSTLHDTRTHE